MSSTQQTPREKLQTLKSLLDDHLINQEDYDHLKASILSELRVALTTTPAEAVVTQLVVQSERRNKDKLYLIVKPEQAGKTFEVLMRMVDTYQSNDTISIIFCDNSLLQVSQTKKRADTEVGLGKICETSSSKNADASSAAELFDTFFENTDKYSTITCCAHPVQVHQNINNFLKKMARCRPTQKFEIYFDEASKVAVSDKMASRIREWEGLCNVEKIYFIDATPESNEGGLLSVYADVTPLHLCYPKGELSIDYIGVDDFDHVEFEPLSGENCIGYARRILDANPLKAGDYAFIPAGFKRKSHYEMRDMLVGKNAVVVVLNGELKGLCIKHEIDGVTTSTDFAETQTSAINDIIERDAWSMAKKLNKPLVITGGMVPGRGLSFQKPGMLFTRGIFGPNIATNAKDRSQKYGRLKGNIRSWIGYTKCMVHSSKKFHDECVIQENFGRWLQQEAFKGREGDETPMDQDTAHVVLDRMMVERGMKKPDIGDPTIVKFEGEEGQGQGKAWFIENLKSVFGGRGPNIREKEEGMYYTSIRTLGKRAYSVSELNENKGWGLGKKEKWRFYPCYTDITNPNTLQWWFIYYPTEQIV